jgi:plastocyanin
VEIADFTFVGAGTVPAGGTVTWTNSDPLEHDVTAKGGAFNSEHLAQGKTYSRRFDSAGSFDYFCSIHPFMMGTVTVK